jgi:hypothetical protein
MKKFNAKTLFGVLAIALTSLFAASAANAYCYPGWVKVTEVDEYSLNGTAYGYVYTVPEHQALPSYTYYFYASNATAVTEAKLALQNHESIYVWGDATSCATTGSYRYSGTLLGLYDY